MRILTYNAEDRKMLLRYLRNHGIFWHGDSNLTPEQVEESWSYKNYPSLSIDFDENKVGGFPDGGTFHRNCLEDKLKEMGRIT